MDNQTKAKRLSIERIFVPLSSIKTTTDRKRRSMAATVEAIRQSKDVKPEKTNRRRTASRVELPEGLLDDVVHDFASSDRNLFSPRVSKSLSEKVQQPPTPASQMTPTTPLRSALKKGISKTPGPARRQRRRVRFSLPPVDAPQSSPGENLLKLVLKTQFAKANLASDCLTATPGTEHNADENEERGSSAESLAFTNDEVQNVTAESNDVGCDAVSNSEAAATPLDEGAAEQLSTPPFDASNAPHSLSTTPIRRRTGIRRLLGTPKSVRVCRTSRLPSSPASRRMSDVLVVPYKRNQMAAPTVIQKELNKKFLGIWNAVRGAQDEEMTCYLCQPFLRVPMKSKFADYHEV